MVTEINSAKTQLPVNKIRKRINNANSQRLRFLRILRTALKGKNLPGLVVLNALRLISSRLKVLIWNPERRRTKAHLEGWN